MSVRAEWWRKFYRGTWQNVQPLLRSNAQTLKEASFIENVFNLKPSAEILDVPCGEGRVAIELAARGYILHGIDFNETLLALGKREAQRRNLQITWHCGDMRHIPWKHRFDAVICMWSSFGYFTKETDDIKFLKSVCQSLKKDGCLLLDTQTAETLYPRYQAKSWYEIDDILMLVDRHLDLTTARNEEEFTFIRKGKRINHHSSIRVYTFQEIVQLLKQCGFGRFKAYGSLARDDFKLGATRLLLTAVKI